MNAIKFTDNSAIKGREDQFVTITIDAQKALESWRTSIFSFEWLDQDGKIKPAAQLSEKEQEKRAAVENTITQSEDIQKPVLGLGLNDNIEIGSGRAQFLTLIAKGLQEIPVHIPKSNIDDFKALNVAVE